jgi:M6 family metalloprotease-like protein
MSGTDIRKNNYTLQLVLGLAILLAGFTANHVYGVPACPRVQQLTQPDGSVINARMWGDEYLNGWETTEGYTIAKNSKGYWTFANVSSDLTQVQTTSKIATNSTSPTGLVKHLRPTATKIQTHTMQKVYPSTGTNYIPVLLINFSDTTTTYTSTNFQNLLFGTNPSIATGPGSFRDFYLNASYNSLKLSSGPSGVSRWLTASGKHDDYGENAGSAKAANLVKEAIEAADKAGFDFSPYDNNGDGYVDVIMVVHQGTGTEAYPHDTTDIWSHSSSLTGAQVGAVEVDGVIADDYIIQPEILYGSITTIGVFCHEFGHAMGLPDLYDYDSDSNGAGDFCLMASGNWNGTSGDTPSYPSAYCRVQLGWVDPTSITHTGAYSLPAVENSDSIFKLQSNNFPNDEYFLVENRQPTGFDEALPGTEQGILIWHIDESQEDNNDQTDYLVDLEEASGTQELEEYENAGDDEDYFRADNAAAFNDTTKPNSLSYSGDELGIGIQSISASKETMTFYVGVPCTLKTYSSPTGAGTIVKTPDETVFDKGATVQLLAIAEDGYAFIRWEGDITTSTENPITVTMSQSREIHAVFESRYQVQVIPTGEGTVARDIMATKVAPNTRITLTATPAAGWEFRKWWGGVDSTQNPVVVTADSNKLIQAEFVNPSLENYSLTVNVVGDGQVFPFGGSFAKDTQVTLTATASGGYEFSKWQGDTVGTTNPLTITINGAKCVTGVFAEADATASGASVQSDEDESDADNTSATVTSTTAETAGKTAATDDSGEFGFSNLINSCTLLGIVLLGSLLAGFSWIRNKQ